MARPTLCTPEIAGRILEQLEAGKSLREICAADDMPSRATVSSWIATNKAGFASQYALAKDIGLDQLAEECLEIADRPLIGEETIAKPDGGVEVRKGDMLGHRRLQIDTRLRLLAKLAPKKYGDLQKIEHSGGVDIAAVLMAARRRVGLADPDPLATAALDVPAEAEAAQHHAEGVCTSPAVQEVAPAGDDVAAILAAARRRGFRRPVDDGSDLA